MCTGVELALLSAGLTTAGSVAQYKSQQGKLDAQDKAATAEAMRQGQIDRDKNQRWQSSLAEFDRGSQEQNLDEATAEREQLLKDVVADSHDDGGTYTSTMAGSAPRVIQEHAEERQGEADDFVSALGNARARLGAWGESQFPLAGTLSDLGFDLSEANTRAGNSGRIGAQEAQATHQDTGNGMALMGNVMTGLGQAGMGYAGRQIGAGSPASYQGPGFGGSTGDFSRDYRLSGLGRNFYNGGGGSY